VVVSSSSAADLELTVKETAGIRRFGYPVAAVLKLDRAVGEGEHFRLLAGGKPVPAQFRVPVRGDGKTVIVDFTADHKPLEKKHYRVEHGPKVPHGPEPAGGIKVEEGEKAFTITSGNMSYLVPRDLQSLFVQVRDRKKEFIARDSPGLHYLARKDGPRVDAGKAARARITREGPLAAALRFEIDSKPPSVVEMVFPRSKSWVEVMWTVPDAEGTVAGLGAGVRLLLQGAPILVDFGAGSGVYTTLRKGQSALLSAGFVAEPAWEVWWGKSGKLEPFVLAAPGEKLRRGEGWVHVMDRQRCTAVAMADFAASGRDGIHTEGDGLLRLTRRYQPATKGTRQLHFWLHFVDMPVQIGALTSPQAMLQPLVVEVHTSQKR
jgi:hypothetical protein